jgi:hypothetical protein
MSEASAQGPWVQRRRAVLAGAVVLLALLAGGAWRALSARRYDPLAVALAAQAAPIGNREAPVPSMCYTATHGTANPCWTCHTQGSPHNHMGDAEQQAVYAFSDVALTNRWTNLFTDRRAAAAAIPDGDILRYIREDNYTPLREAMARVEVFPGWRPDVDLARGFDAEGFARDGSGWRALRYKPFLGTFWATNGSTDDVFIRLPVAFRRGADGAESREVYKANLAILEAAMTGDPAVRDAGALRRRVEPLDERAAGVDLDGDGALEARVEEVLGLPRHYAGAAAGQPVERLLYPVGVEFLHTVRYVDPDAGGMLATRMKEVRYSRKVEPKEPDVLLGVYQNELDAKELGKLPRYAGAAESGLLNDFGWQLQGYIEDAEGRLRLQTHEEHLACMGCHTGIGVTVDQTFAFVRKVPGAEGWRPQDVRGIPDVPQAGHALPEALTYFERVGGGDEFRSNEEVRARFFRGGTLDTAEVLRAAPGGDRDLAHLTLPSRERALALNKAYRALVLAQGFAQGRDTLLAPPENVHRRIEAESTGLAESGRVYLDGRLHLDWGWRPGRPAARAPAAGAGQAGPAQTASVQ